MSDPNMNQQGANAPKQSPFKPLTPVGAASGHDATAPHTVILKKPAGEVSAPPVEPPSQGQAVAPGIAITHAQAAKKMTARIDISSASAPAASAAIPVAKPKTVRLRSPNKVTAPISAPPPSQTQSGTFTPVQPPITKSKTSRITLDTALSSAPSLPNHSDQPHTIRLKRPDSVTSQITPNVAIKPPTTNINMPPMNPVTGGVSAPQTNHVAAPGTSSSIEEPPSPTRRKTIKVKRPNQKGSGHKLTLNKEAAANLETESENLQSLSAPDMMASPKPVDKVNPFFIVAASIAILITINLMWVFAAQAFGPQGAVTDFRTLVSPNLPTPPGAMTINY